MPEETIGIEEKIGNGVTVYRPAPGITNSSSIVPMGRIVINTFFYMSLIMLIAILICLLANRIKKGKFSFNMIIMAVISFVIFVVAAYTKGIL